MASVVKTDYVKPKVESVTVKLTPVEITDLTQAYQRYYGHAPNWVKNLEKAARGENQVDAAAFAQAALGRPFF